MIGMNVVTPESWYVLFWIALSVAVIVVGAALGAAILYYVVTRPLLGAIRARRSR